LTAETGDTPDRPVGHVDVQAVSVRKRAPSSCQLSY
jgi:hypothetical protein